MNKDIPVYSGHADWYSGSTAFGFYDEDQQFRDACPKVARFCASRCGWPLMDVELQPSSFHTAFEEAITTYGNQIYAWKVKENYLALEGGSASGSANNLIMEPTLQRLVEIAKNYGTEADVGGNIALHTGSLEIKASQQRYDLGAWAIDQGITDGIEVRRIFYEAPPAIMRYFDPYAGTGTGIQSLMDAFDFGSYSPGVNFLLMPVSADILKIQAIEFNDQVRRSAYSFRLSGNQLEIFPIPQQGGNLRFEYYKMEDKRKLGYTESTPDNPLITNISEVPYTNPIYSNINSVGKQWIFRYTLALCKEMLAYVRGKYQQLPIPNGNTTLNQSDLLSDARTEKENLIKELTDQLDATSRKEQLNRKAEEAENLRKTLAGVPTPIYIG